MRSTRMWSSIRNKKEEKETHESLEGGFSVAYFHKKDLVKINGTYYRETGKSIVEYYFENGKLLFIFEKDFNYNKPISTEPVHIRSTQENRLYFENGILMKWIDDHHKEVPPDAKSFSTAGKVWTIDAEKQLKLFTK